jgi:hypothetical protein
LNLIINEKWTTFLLRKWFRSICEMKWGWETK